MKKASGRDVRYRWRLIGGALAACLAACGGKGDQNCMFIAYPSVDLTVKDASAAVIGDANVTFSVDGGPWTSATCNPPASGTWCLGFDPGTYDIKAESVDGKLHAEQSVVVDETADACHYVNTKTVVMTLK